MKVSGYLVSFELRIRPTLVLMEITLVSVLSSSLNSITFQFSEIYCLYLQLKTDEIRVDLNFRNIGNLNLDSILINDSWSQSRKICMSIL